MEAFKYRDDKPKFGERFRSRDVSGPAEVLEAAFCSEPFAADADLSL
jgi:hypothetical protein